MKPASPGIHISTWLRLLGAQGHAARIVAKINAAAVAAMADPATQKRIADLGMDLPPPRAADAGGVRRLQKAEVEKWYPIVEGGRASRQQ